MFRILTAKRKCLREEQGLGLGVGKVVRIVASNEHAKVGDKLNCSSHVAKRARRVHSSDSAGAAAEKDVSSTRPSQVSKLTPLIMNSISKRKSVTI